MDFYIGPVLVGQAYVEMAVGKSNDRSNATEKSNVLGPVTKVDDGYVLKEKRGVYIGCCLPFSRGPYLWQTLRQTSD